MIYGVATQVLLKPIENEDTFLLKVRCSTRGTGILLPEKLLAGR